MLLFFMGCTVARMLVKRTNIFKSSKIVWLIFIPYVIQAIVGLKNLGSYPRQYIADLATFINFFAGFLLIRMYFVEREDVDKLLVVLINSVAARTIVGLFWFFMGIGYTKGVVLLPFYDPVGAFPLFILLLGGSILLYDNLPKGHKMFLMIIITLSTIFQILWPARGQWLFFVVGVIFVSSYLSVRKKLLFKIRMVFLISVLGGMLLYYKGDLVRYSMWKLGTITNFFNAYSSGENIAQRKIEWINVKMKLMEEKKILFGDGAGSWFDDRYYPFSFNDGTSIVAESAFTQTQLLEWKFFKPHGMQINLFMKSGLVGLGCYTYALFLIMVTVWKRAKSVYDGHYKSILIGVCVPCIYQLLGFSAKNFVLSGILLAVIVNVFYLSEIREETTYAK